MCTDHKVIFLLVNTLKKDHMKLGQFLKQEANPLKNAHCAKDISQSTLIPKWQFFEKRYQGCTEFAWRDSDWKGEETKQNCENLWPRIPWGSLILGANIIPMMESVCPFDWNMYFHQQNTVFISQVNINVLTPYFTSPKRILPEKSPKRRWKVKPGMHDSTGRKLLCWDVKMVHKNTGNCTVAQGYLFTPGKKEN